ncbi:Fe-ARD 2 [Coprinellus micaceus]|uniref:Acireductone dioxygenase n=1 Tax=Coprinellus micaceus TaxID=71717 RepID=A0A4Y7TUI6_COPMI|nr:Fe-ARD 2 [Coprinellus micaceus]
MRAWYFDNKPGHQKLAHMGEHVPNEVVYKLGIKHWKIPLEGHEKVIDEIAKERDYPNRDVINISKEGLGKMYDEKMVYFFQEHMHEDEEIRYILDGTGYYDIRETPSDTWIRFQIEAEDLVIIPVGIYHRFTLDEGDYIKSIRLFRADPKWIYLCRSPEMDVNPYRLEYVNETKEKFGVEATLSWGQWLWSWLAWRS